MKKHLTLTLTLSLALVTILKAYPTIAQAQDGSTTDSLSISHNQLSLVRELIKQRFCGDRAGTVNRAFATINYVADLSPDQVLRLDEVRIRVDEVDPVIQQACDEVETMGDDFLASMNKRRLIIII